MKKLWKRNAVVGAVLVLVCGAIYLNGLYAAKVTESAGHGKLLGESVLVDAPQKQEAAEVAGGAAQPKKTEDAEGAEEPADSEQPQETAEPSQETAPVSSDYFAAARLTRQQARDSALTLLQEASEGESVDPQVASEAAASIQTLAGYALSEAQIESMVTAKGYTDCVVFLGDESASVVVSTATDGLQTEDVARITDIVKQETGLPASAIKIMEVD